MNDPIKYMLTAAGIALVSATAGGMLVGVMMTKVNSEEFRVKSEGRQIISSQPSAFNSQLFSSQPKKTNASMQAAPSGNWLPSPAAFQKAQDLPEVKLAKDEFMQAQSRYIATIRSALENPANAAKIRESLPPGMPLSVTPPVRFTGTNKVQRTLTSGQATMGSSQPAQK